VWATLTTILSVMSATSKRLFIKEFNMDKNELTKLNPEVLAVAILNMGHIIRTLDEDNEYLDYWTQDGDYINSLPYLKARV
jgi:hypothetical protein